MEKPIFLTKIENSGFSIITSCNCKNASGEKASSNDYIDKLLREYFPILVINDKSMASPYCPPWLYYRALGSTDWARWIPHADFQLFDQVWNSLARRTIQDMSIGHHRQPVVMVVALNPVAEKQRGLLLELHLERGSSAPVSFFSSLSCLLSPSFSGFVSCVTPLEIHCGIGWDCNIMRNESTVFGPSSMVIQPKGSCCVKGVVHLDGVA